MNSKSVVAIALLSALALPVFAQTGAAAAPAATPAPAAAKADAAKTDTKHAAKHKTLKQSAMKKTDKALQKNQLPPRPQHQQQASNPFRHTPAGLNQACGKTPSRCPTL